MKISEEQLEKGTLLIAKFMKLSRRPQSDRFLDLEDEVSSYSLSELKSGYINNYSYLMGVVDKIVKLEFDLLYSPSISIASNYTRISFDGSLFTGEDDDIRTSVWLSVTKFLEYYYANLEKIDTNVLIADIGCSCIFHDTETDKLHTVSDLKNGIGKNHVPKNIIVVSNKKVIKPEQGKCYITECVNQTLSNKVVIYLCDAPNAIDCSCVRIYGKDYTIPNSFFDGSREVIKAVVIETFEDCDNDMSNVEITNIISKINNNLVEVNYLK